MKTFKVIAGAVFAGGALLISTAAGGCKKEVDLFNYVSEYRSLVYLTKEDNFELKIYCGEKETPYLADGVKGNLSAVTEIFYTQTDTPEKVSVDIDGAGGEMSYMSATRSFYLSYAGVPEKSRLDVKLTVDGREIAVCASSVAEEGVLDGRAALNCVKEYDKRGFDELCEGGIFNGEIHIRLLYDDGCYYYVGVCKREGGTHAYLVDGTSGRILAERTGEN